MTQELNPHKEQPKDSWAQALEFAGTTNEEFKAKQESFIKKLEETPLESYVQEMEVTKAHFTPDEILLLAVYRKANLVHMNDMLQSAIMQVDLQQNKPNVVDSPFNGEEGG